MKTKRFRHANLLLTSLFVLCSAPLALGQDTTTIVVGTGTIINGAFDYPAPMGNAQPGARHQMLLLADELLAAGMGSGDILSMALDVAQPASVTYEGFTVSIASTAITEVTEQWEQGLTPVFGPAFVTDQAGWNEFPFTSPFTWDGLSNVLVQTCFFNQGAIFNAQFNQTATPFNSTLWRSTPNGNVCFANGGTLNLAPQRPNMRFSWVSDAAAPIAAFAQSATSTCNGTVVFTDLSEFEPTTWAWDFGDGNSSADQYPTHTYATDGIYTPVLIVTNALGADTVEGAPITVSTSSPRPIDACVPASIGTLGGFGILSVTVGDVTVTSPDAVTEGYADRSCLLDTVLAGTNLDIAVITGSITTHNVRAWIDWDNDGEFVGSEEVLSANNVNSANTTIAVPVFAITETPLRVRVMADFDFSPIPSPCVPPQYGQAEDYGLVVLPNNLPPVALFSADPQFSCSGSVQFTDASTNVPTAWTWDFGDGNGSNSNAPLHTYAASGTYTVSLVVVNTFGADTLIVEDMITVDLGAQLVPAVCTPNTQNYCCEFGITSVALGGIVNTSPDGVEGYVDRSCGNTAEVTAGVSYPYSIGTGGAVNHDVRVWVDLDNDGAFTANELVINRTSVQDPNGTFTMPGGSIFGTPLRMRVLADVVGVSTSACDEPSFGQVEDYSLILSPNPNPPVAAFNATPTNTCTGIVQFTDASQNAPLSWAWQFGDGGTSDAQSPQHTYFEAGTYTVTLTVTNTNGSDEITQVDLITFAEAWACDTISIPGGGPAQESQLCQGVLTDNGGAQDDYTPGQSALFTIAPASAETVTLFFSQFEFEDGFDFLRIYDGPSDASPEIGTGFTGSGLANLPNGGVITSSGPAISLRQDASMGPTTWEGFILSWDCSFTGIAEAALNPIVTVWPQPADEAVNLEFNAPAGKDWTLELHDLTGALLERTNIPSGSTTWRMDRNNRSAGMYQLVIATPAGRWTRGLVLR